MQKLKPEDNQLTPEQRLARERAFAVWVTRARYKIGLNNIPLEFSHEVQGMLRKAFNAGTNYEARCALEESENA